MRLNPFPVRRSPGGPRTAAIKSGSAWSAILGAAFVSAFLWSACSLNLEDPEVEARKKLAKQVAPSWELLEGRWIGDSTYTLFDTRAQRLDGGLVLDILPDSTLLGRDTLRAVLPGSISASARLSRDTLYIRGTAISDTFLVRMRFLGNWLELVRPSDHRSTHLHKLKPFDSRIRDSLLDSGIWISRFHRPAFDTFNVHDHRRDFDYLLFPGDSLVRDTRRDGLSKVESGPLSVEGRRFGWAPSGGSRTVFLDLYHPDSLRFWTLDGDRADSGFSLYTRTDARHPFDLDMTPYAGHLRTDTLRRDFDFMDNHFGRFYDLILGSDHSVSTLTNMPGLPRYRGWSVDSGRLWLEDEAAAKMRFTVEPVSPKSLRMRGGAGGGFVEATTLIQTVVDGSRFAAHPLERFETAGYMHLTVGPDTLAYYFLSASQKTSPEEHELARIDSTDTLWVSWRMNPSLETYGSSQAGFLFAFQGRTAALGRFTCRSLPSIDMAIRTTSSADPNLANGLVQGSCRIIASETPPADSNLAVTGEFRSQRRIGGVRSPLWKLP